MNSKPIVFADANPNPEISPEEAYKAGAYIVNNKFEILGRIPYKGVEDAILNLENIYMLVLDGLVTLQLLQIEPPF